MQMKTIRSSNPVVRNALRIRNAAAITIKPSPTADTRSADHEVTIDELRKSSEQHIGDVRKGMDYAAALLRQAGERHDFTKTKYLKEFFDDFRRAQETGIWTNGWFDRIHKVQERHHLNDRVPEEFRGLDRFAARELCVRRMSEAGLLEKVEDITHAVGYSERGNVPIETLVSAQWFCRMGELAKPAIDSVK